MSPHPPPPFKFKACPDTPTPNPQPPWPGGNRVRTGMLPGKMHPVLAGRPWPLSPLLEIHPPDPATHAKDPVVQAAAVSRGAALGERGRGLSPPPCCSSSVPRKGKKTGHVCVGRGQGRLHTLHVCSIKTWLHPQDSWGNLKRQASAGKANKGSWDFVLFCFVSFSTTSRLCGAGWNRARGRP